MTGPHPKSKWPRDSGGDPASQSTATVPPRTIIDDSRNASTPGAQNPSITYSPVEFWFANRICQNCSVDGFEVMDRLSNTAAQGTWTNAWWNKDARLLTAGLDFQGSDISAHFILFFRSKDVGDGGDSQLRFLVDQQVMKQLPINPTAYTFQNDFTSRLTLFNHSGLNPSVNHQFQIQWTHNGTRPRVAVALDTIEFQPTASSTATDPSTTPTSLSPFKVTVGTIVGPTVASVVVVFAILVSLLCYRRRKMLNQLNTLPMSKTRPASRIPNPLLATHPATRQTGIQPVLIHEHHLRDETDIAFIGYGQSIQPFHLPPESCPPLAQYPSIRKETGLISGTHPQHGSTDDVAGPSGIGSRPPNPTSTLVGYGQAREPVTKLGQPNHTPVRDRLINGSGPPLPSGERIDSPGSGEHESLPPPYVDDCGAVSGRASSASGRSTMYLLGRR